MKKPNFFKVPTPVTVEEIALTIDAVIHGNKDIKISDLSALEDIKPNSIACLHNRKYINVLKNCSQGVCIMAKEHLEDCPPSVTALVVEKPYRAFGKVANLLYPAPTSSGVISKLSDIHPSAKIGKNCQVDAFVTIRKDCVIGDNTVIKSHVSIGDNVTIGMCSVIENHVTLNHCTIGNHAFIKPGARIGQQGFGFFMDESGHFDIPQLGSVIIGDHVQIGANTTIDRGSQHNTVIKFGCRIDNLVQIAHNVEVGENSVLVAQVGIAGSTKLGQFVIVAGQTGIAGHLNIGSGSKIAGQSGVMKDAPPGSTIAGTPAINAIDWHRQTIALKKIIKKN